MGGAGGRRRYARLANPLEVRAMTASQTSTGSHASEEQVGGFLAKFYVFSAAYDSGWTWLVIVGAGATLVSLYYYLGVVRALYMRSPLELRIAPAGGSPPRETLLQTGVVLCVAVTVGSFFAAEPLIDLARHAAESIPFD